MKKIFIILLAAISCKGIKAQGVGIGTTTPNASAQLDIVSPLNNKGLLIPRMTSAQRLAIASPIAPGLMVYETTTSSFWFYNGSVWNQIGTGGASPWTVSGTNIYNSNTGNVGIGTSSPTYKFHVAGNNMLINGTNPIFQLQQAGVSTGFVQLSSDDLRIGTNSGNTAGAMVIRMNGTDRVFVDSIGQVGIGRSAPTYDLDINGNQRIQSTSTGTKSVLSLYANPFLAVDPTGFGSSYISFFNFNSIGGGNYSYTSKYKLEFEGGSSERLKMYHASYPDQFVLDKDGDVGINVLPSEKLHVVGDMLLQNVNPILKLKMTGAVATTKSVIQFNSSSANLGNIAYTNSSLILSGSDTTVTGNVVPDLVIKSGNIGLGTATPTEKLHLIGNMLVNYINPIIQFQQSATDKGFIQLNGNDLRIGTNSSNINGKFVVKTAAGDQFFVDNAGYIGIGVPGANAEARVHVGTGLGAGLTSNGYLMLGNTSGINVVFDNNEIQARSNNTASGLTLQRSGGTVRIGATPVPSGYKFAIDGKVICEELKVKLVSSGWPDYVFADNYKLSSLTEIEKFINLHKHLPNMPSAAEVEKNGIEVGDMQKKVMEKIEELTLYVIQLEKQVAELKKEKK